MTTFTAPRTEAEAPARSLRALLALDGAGTAALGVAALVLAAPLADHVGTPDVLRAVGVLFVVLGVDMLLARRLRGRSLAAAAAALALLDLGWAAGTTLALPAIETTAVGTAAVLAVAGVCVVMGTGKLLLARRLGG